MLGWPGERVRLVPLDVDRHLENAVRWLNDPRLTEWLLVGDEPMTRLAERDWMERMSRRVEGELSFAIESLAGEHIGFSGIHQISYRHGTALTGSFLGPEHWTKGYGTDAGRVRLRYIFEVMGLRMVTSSCMAHNVRSYGMLTKCGYVEYGRLPKQFWKRGEFRDMIHLYIDREMWLAQQSGTHE